MVGSSGSLARLTASATPLLWEASLDLKQFAIQRWLFAASFAEETQRLRVQLSRLAGAAAVVGQSTLSYRARELRAGLFIEGRPVASHIKVIQRFFSGILSDGFFVDQLARSDRALSWFGQGFLEEAELATAGI